MAGATVVAAPAVRPAPSNLTDIHVSQVPRLKKTADVLGLAQAMVDYTASLPSEDILGTHPFNVTKGGRRVISLDERHAVIEALESLECKTQVTPGGSLANTLVGISRLSGAHGHKLRVSMAGCVGTDTLGSYFSAQLKRAGVNVLVDQDNMANTGTVIVLTEPGAQRSFLSFFDSGSLRMTAGMAAAVSSAKLVIIEGYMLELPGAATWLPAVAAAAHSGGAQIVLTCGDPTVVARHRATLRTVLDGGLVDLLFCNREEAEQLLREPAADSSAALPEPATAHDLADQLSRMVSGLAVVTDGSRGAWLSRRGAVKHVPPHWAPRGPVDVCGAGDAFAAGVLFGVLSGYDIKLAGQFAARVAATVISRHGAQLEPEDAEQLVTHLPDHVPLPWTTSLVVHPASDTGYMHRPAPPTA